VIVIGFPSPVALLFLPNGLNVPLAAKETKKEARDAGKNRLPIFRDAPEMGGT
jgi:hypothetical protein